MKRLLLTFILCAGFLSAATIDNVTVAQRWPWSQKVDIFYNLTTDAPRQIDVSVFQGDTPVPMPDAAFSGDRHNVTSGSRHIVFDPSLTPYTNRVMTALRFVLTPREMPPYLIIDLSKPKTDPEQVTWVTAYDLTNSASSYGAWEMGSTFHTGSEIDPRWEDAVVWTGVTNNTAYKTYKLVMRYIPAGTFQMGMKSDPWTYDWWELRMGSHEVTLTKGFYAAVFQTTQGQHVYITNGVSGTFSSSLATSVSLRNWMNYNYLRGTDLGTNWPVSASVDANSAVGRLRAKTGLETIDLPTEAQWEYACRAGATGLFHDGSSTLCSTNDLIGETLDLLAWNSHNSGHSYRVPGQKMPNGWGLYDTLGNAWELCLDWGGFNGNSYISENTDPKGRTSGDGRIARGGSVWASAKYCNCAHRKKYDVSTADASNGPTLCYRLFMTVE
ncbi:MAG: formylglycine-generating enzyme family protein [Kiritimatiellae bacterium]|nr:formylglycine-generating enzyme family protein [Kiritimatiellia bacterium]